MNDLPDGNKFLY